MTLQPGAVLNQRYRIDSQIGQGDLGAVYAAWDLNLNTAVAVKEQHIATPEATRRFTRVARALAGLRHPGLPYVIDHFSLQGTQYLVMEFVAGQDLSSYLTQAGRSLSAAQILPWFIQACEALAYLHRQDPPVYHRDIKPANLRITAQGAAMLVDYGIGLAANPEHATTRAQTRPSLETAAYTPPEARYGTYDARSDVFALAATLYTGLCRQPPAQPPRPLRTYNPAVPAALEATVMRALAADPAQRFASAEDFHGALLDAAAHSAPAPAYSAPAATVLQPVAPPPAGQPATQVVPPNYGYPAPARASAPRVARELARQSAPPQAPRRSLPLLLAGLVGLCLLLALVGGVAAYQWAGSGTPVAVNQDQAVAATISAVAAAWTVTPALPLPLDAPQVVGAVTPSLTPLGGALVPQSGAGMASATPTPTWTATWTLTPSATWSLTPDPHATWRPCDADYASRLHVGDIARVSFDPPLANNVRTQPNRTSAVVGQIQPGEQMKIVGGPACSNRWVWWQISSLSTGITGWTAEGDANDYWLELVP